MRHLAVVLLLTLVGSIAHASDDAVQRGKKMSRAAVDLARSGSYAEAIELFEKAHKLTGDAMILYNIGQVAARMGDLPKAKEYLERFLKAEMKPDALERGRKALAEVLARWPGWLRVTSPTNGALVEVDEKPVGRTPLERPIELSPGKHALKVLAPGKHPFEREIEVAASDAIEVSATLEDEPRRLSVQVQPDTARLLLDGKAVEPARWSQITLAPGAHFLRADAEGYEGQDQTVDLAAGEEKSLSLALVAKPKPVIAVAKPEPPAPSMQKPAAANDLSGAAVAVEKKGLATWQWVLIGGGAAAVLAGGIVAGVLLANSGGGGRAYDGEMQLTNPLEVGR